jgi:hypothetical protein
MDINAFVEQFNAMRETTRMAIEVADPMDPDDVTEFSVTGVRNRPDLYGDLLVLDGHFLRRFRRPEPPDHDDDDKQDEEDEEDEER